MKVPSSRQADRNSPQIAEAQNTNGAVSEGTRFSREARGSVHSPKATTCVEASHAATKGFWFLQVNKLVPGSRDHTTALSSHGRRPTNCVELTNTSSSLTDCAVARRNAMAHHLHRKRPESTTTTSHKPVTQPEVSPLSRIVLPHTQKKTHTLPRA